jgi:hypothetical protein
MIINNSKEIKKKEKKKNSSRKIKQKLRAANGKHMTSMII